MSRFDVGFVIFPDLTQLDFTGPQQVLGGWLAFELKHDGIRFIGWLAPGR